MTTHTEHNTNEHNKKTESCCGMECKAGSSRLDCLCQNAQSNKGITIIIILLVINIIVGVLGIFSVYNIEATKMGGRENYREFQKIMKSDAFKKAGSDQIEMMKMQMEQMQSQSDMPAMPTETNTTNTDTETNTTLPSSNTSQTTEERGDE